MKVTSTEFLASGVALIILGIVIGLSYFHRNSNPISKGIMWFFESLGNPKKYDALLIAFFYILLGLVSLGFWLAISYN